jgi:hypothetical protein
MRRSSGSTVASTAFRATFVTTRNAPHAGAERVQISTISKKTKDKYFCAKDWTTQISLKRLAKFDFTRMAPRSFFSASRAGDEGTKQTDLPARAPGLPRPFRRPRQLQPPL